MSAASTSFPGAHSGSMRGILSGDGTAMVHALVYHHPTPEQPPPALADLVEPVPGTTEDNRDWQLSMRQLLAHRDEHVHDVWSAFTTWRRGYVADRVLGDVATVRAFLRWADTVRDVTTLHPMNLLNACIPVKSAARVAFEVHEVEKAARERGELGLGITVPQRSGLVRGFVLEAEPLLVLADDHAAVYALPDGLRLTSPDMQPLLVHGWLVEADGVSAISDEGPVPLGGAAAGRLLVQIAPGVANASVGPVPLRSVFSGLMLGLRESAELASIDRIPLWIRTGNVGPARYVVR
jgi:hypothetical protein